MSLFSTQMQGLKATARTATITQYSPSSELFSVAHFPLLRNSVSECSLISSKQNTFCRGQFDIRHFFGIRLSRRRRSRVGAAVAPPSCVLPLTEENVERVLEEVRPGLMADGGNVVLHEIDGLVVVLKLQGACGSCPSSTMTLKMGIETRLMDKIPEIQAVEQILDTETGLELNEENVEKAQEVGYLSSFRSTDMWSRSDSVDLQQAL
ncbi:nifU-like protein 3, chloroplastic isoform X3 [Tasmannia lanceolata]|uniref:nifU-like protein 3, chloroplastic isoform X3 n=1 Tax=Tasmannia lanceolata TaxID=3420 RepID=UPI0040640C03